MIRHFGLKSLVLLGLIALTNVSFKNPKVTIYHNANGNWMLLNVPVSALQGHAQHGDVYFSTCCPVSGPENACR